jgi:adenine-specific DNA-methyltransferase
MTKKQKLELTWVGKENRPRLEPRILLEDPARSYLAKHRVNDDDIFDNRLIFGDNLLALKSLEYEFSGKVKCIYIDPPYNTGSAFEHYDDGVEHSLWLSLMRDRLEILRRLLTEDGFLFVQIDNNEMAYLKVLMDEIFGRNCFINDIIWKRRGGSANPNNRLNNVTDYLLWYSKQPNAEIRQLFSMDDENTQDYIVERFTGDLNGRKFMLAPVERNAKLGTRETLRFEYKGYKPQYGWMMSRDNLERLDVEGRLHWNGKGRPNRRVFLEDYQGQPIGNLWTDVKVINPMAIERLNFDGQKPERLIERVLQLTTQPGDLVLDSFAGSGTTAAVAHKMRRRWITIELGDHCHTHIIPRMKKIIDGEDKGGITESVGWQGGGGFRYFRLAPSLIETDKWGREVISKAYNAAMLAEALCKIEGFAYAPSDAVYWQHGHSTERDFIYVTTQTLGVEQLQQLSEEVGTERSLLVLCSAFRGNPDRWPNLTVKKIPNQIRSRCEWGHDDYSLNVENLPKAPPRPEPEAKSAVKAGAGQPDLFGAKNGGSR